MREIFLDNDFEPEVTLARKNATTGAAEPATGITGLRFKLCAVDGGSTPINALLNVPAAERGVLGVYYGTLQGDDLRTYCATLVGSTVYLVFGDGLNVLTSEPVRIVGIRRPA